MHRRSSYARFSASEIGRATKLQRCVALGDDEDKDSSRGAARPILLREIVVFLLRKMSTILKKATIFFWPVHGDLRPPIRNIGKGRLTAFSHQKPQILDFSPRCRWGTLIFLVLSSFHPSITEQHWGAKRVLADGDFVEVQT